MERWKRHFRIISFVFLIFSFTSYNSASEVGVNLTLACTSSVKEIKYFEDANMLNEIEEVSFNPITVELIVDQIIYSNKNQLLGGQIVTEKGREIFIRSGKNKGKRLRVFVEASNWDCQLYKPR